MYKFQSQRKNVEMQIIHDTITEFEKTFISEFENYNINIMFADSKKKILLQIADNVASIFCHCIKNMIKRFETKIEWKVESQWDMELVSKILHKIGINNIKFTIPIHDWAAAVCVEQMFAPNYPKANRKNIYFNSMYLEVQNQIKQSIIFYSKYVDDVEKILKD